MLALSALPSSTSTCIAVICYYASIRSAFCQLISLPTYIFLDVIDNFSISVSVRARVSNAYISMKGTHLIIFLTLSIGAFYI